MVSRDTSNKVDLLSDPCVRFLQGLVQQLAHLPRGTMETRSTLSRRPVRWRRTHAISALPASCTAIARFTASRSGSGGRRTPWGCSTAGVS